MDKGVYLRKLGKRVVTLRTAKEISQSELARLADKDRQSIYRFEKGQINPSIIYLKEIAEALKIEVKELVDI